MALITRQPFAELGSSRLHALHSTKNKQNAATENLSPLNQPATGKRPAPSAFDDDEDSENIDPSVLNSPSKKSKAADGTSKPKFSLLTSPSVPSLSTAVSSPTTHSVRKALSSPNTTKTTPISLTRGSPKQNKRVGLLSKRRASSSPFRRVDPPAPSQSGLPFSIDAALKGSIPRYASKSAINDVCMLDECMPRSWFFAIHEDTPDQEAANLMEHSATMLDISSDDDAETKRRNEFLDRGKENIPPPDFVPAQSPTSAPEGARLPRLRNITQDNMDEDRRPLSDLRPADFYADGLDATSCVTVDAGIEHPSGLSKEVDANCLEEETVVEEPIPVFADETATPDLAVPASPVAEDATLLEQEPAAPAMA